MAATEGYHSSVFLYGQTGTGKTYTMQVLSFCRLYGFEAIGLLTGRTDFLC